jgi:hypothetical protein
MGYTHAWESSKLITPADFIDVCTHACLDAVRGRVHRSQPTWRRLHRWNARGGTLDIAAAVGVRAREVVDARGVDEALSPRVPTHRV